MIAKQSLASKMVFVPPTVREQSDVSVLYGPSLQEAEVSYCVCSASSIPIVHQLNTFVIIGHEPVQSIYIRYEIRLMYVY